MIFLDISFWKDFAANTFATLVGVLFGIPIALWLNREQQKSAANHEKEKAEKETEIRKKKILHLIAEELRYNKTTIATVISEHQWVRDFYKLKDELWNTLMAGGEIYWIDDVILLDKMASAYYAVKLLIKIRENLAYEGAESWDDWSDTLQSHINLAQSSIDNALGIIEQNHNS